jgi:hypothetical protein
VFTRWVPGGNRPWDSAKQWTYLRSKQGMPPYESMPQVDTPGFWLITLVSLSVAILAETFLRFRVAAAFALPANSIPRRFHILAPINHSIHQGWKHWGLVTAHLGLLRLGVVAVRVAFVALPIVLAERVINPRAAQAVAAPWLYPICVLLVALSGALVEGVITAFVAVYDARLFAALQTQA